MNILIDGQTLHTREMHRGIGRYFLEVLKRLSGGTREDRIFIATVEDAALDGFQGVPPVILKAPVDAGADPDLKALQYRQGLQDIVSKEGIEVFWNPNPLMDNVLYPGRLAGCMSIATVHDLIPLKFPEQYLDRLDPGAFDDYIGRLTRLPLLDGIIAVSKATRDDLLRYTSVPEQKITVIYEGVGGMFFDRPSRTDAEEVGFRYGLPRDFLFSFGGENFRKNNDNLIRSFAILIKKYSRDIALVLGSDFTKEYRDGLTRLAEELGVAGKVMFTGAIPDGDLTAIYNLSTVFVFPSLYEGFGLPVLEAMAAGTPVAASNASSIPEVLGDAGIYFDPADPEDIAAKLAKLLDDGDMRKRFSEASALRAGEFNWDKTVAEIANLFASRPVKTGEKTLPGAKAERKKTRMAFFSPLNPQHSGIADYSEDLLAHLRRYAKVDLFVDGIIPSNPDVADNFRYYDYKEFEKMAASYDTILYHMGNNTLHEYIYKTLKRFPGITVLHDYNIHSFIRSTTLTKGDHQAYINEIEACYGQLGRFITEKIKKYDFDLNVHRFSLNDEVFNSSKAVIVHSRWCMEQTAGNNVFVVPHGINIEPLTTGEIRSIRDGLGITQDTLMLACLGDIVFTKRIDVVIKAFSIFRLFNKEAKLFLIGKRYPDMEDKVRRLVDFYGLEGSTTITGKVDLDIFKKYMKASDIILNLRYPTMGETSGSLIRAMSYGKPVIVSNVNQFREFPDDCCLKVDVCDREQDIILSHLMRLGKDPLLRKKVGDKAKRYVEENCSWEKAALKYLDVIDRVLN